MRIPVAVKIVLVGVVLIAHVESHSVCRAQTVIENLSVSPDGKQAAITVAESKPDSSTVRRLGLVQLGNARFWYFSTPEKAIGPGSTCAPSWSPDGTKLAFMFIADPADVPPGFYEQQMAAAVAGRRTTGVGCFQIWVGDTRTCKAERLFADMHSIWFCPKFSPDGKQLLAWDGTSQNVALLNTVSGSFGFLFPTTLWSPACVHRYGFDWNREGTAAYLSVGPDIHGNREGSGIWRVDLSTGTRTRLSRDVVAQTISVSSVDSLLALTVWNGETPNDDSWSVQVVRMPGFVTHVLSKRSTEKFVAWSRTGERLAFCEKGQIAIWTVDTDAPSRTAIPEGQPSMLSWVGGTSSILYILDGRDIWMFDTESNQRNHIACVSGPTNSTGPILVK